MSRSNSPKRKRQSAHRGAVLAPRSCPSGKRGYPTRSQAKRAMKITNRERQAFGDPKLELHVYACRLCPLWHTTSQAQC